MNLSITLVADGTVNNSPLSVSFLQAAIASVDQHKYHHDGDIAAVAAADTLTAIKVSTYNFFSLFFYFLPSYCGFYRLNRRVSLSCNSNKFIAS